MQLFKWGSLVILTGIASHGHASCGASFCALANTWQQQQSAEPVYRLDLRYEHITQDQPRYGADKVDFGSVHRHHDEQRTQNQNWVASLDYANQDWGWNLSVPWVKRQHDHIHNHRGAQLHDAWQFDGFGDIKLLGRYQPQQSPVALLFGLKLASGQTDQTNEQGAKAEPGLQPGTGTSDWLAGVSAQGQFAAGETWFSRLLWQQALKERDQFKPGKQVSLDLGLGHRLNSNLELLLQLNGHSKTRDSGGNAEPEDSGGRSLWLSPGVAWNWSSASQIYGFWQQPLYQKVNGVQLTANQAWSLGLNHRF